MAAALDVRTDLLGLLGVESIDHAPAGAAARMLADLNAARQEIYIATGSAFWSEEFRADLVQAPTGVVLGAVTANSKSITFAGIQTWMRGCTIVINGDTTQNRLVMDAAATVSLLKPYTGVTATNVSATVYHDVLNPGDDVEQILAPVMLEGYGEVTPLPHERDRIAGSGPLYPLGFKVREIVMPKHYVMERLLIKSTGVVTPVARFESLPSEAARVSYRVKLAPTAVTDLSADARTQLVPLGYHESMLLPIVRYKFSTWNQFTGDKTGLAEDYKAALTLLASLKPRGDMQTNVQVGEDW